MSDDKEVLVTDINSAVANVTPRVPMVVVGAIVAGGLVAGALAGIYWVCGIFAVGGLFAFMRIAKNRTAQHERGLSLPPALVTMKQRLGSLSLEPSLNPIATRAQNQLQRLESGLKQATDLLRRKLDPSELAFSRFQMSLQDGASAVFYELQDTVEHLNQASLIGAREQASEPSKTQATNCLDENEKALETFAAAVAAIAAMETNSARIELPQAIHELEQIAARTKRLSLKQGDQNE